MKKVSEAFECEKPYLLDEVAKRVEALGAAESALLMSLFED